MSVDTKNMRQNAFRRGLKINPKIDFNKLEQTKTLYRTNEAGDVSGRKEEVLRDSKYC